jgi:hypothetical protein
MVSTHALWAFNANTMQQKRIRRTRISVCHQLSSPVTSDTPRPDGPWKVVHEINLQGQSTRSLKQLYGVSLVDRLLREPRCFFYEPGNCEQWDSLDFPWSSYCNPHACPLLSEIYFNIIWLPQPIHFKLYVPSSMQKGAPHSSRVPRNFFGGGVQQIQLRTEGRENGDLGAVAPSKGFHSICK